jgi:hypothetical protein
MKLRIFSLMSFERIRFRIIFKKWKSYLKDLITLFIWRNLISKIPYYSSNSSNMKKHKIFKCSFCMALLSIWSTFSIVLNKRDYIVIIFLWNSHKLLPNLTMSLHDVGFIKLFIKSFFIKYLIQTLEIYIVSSVPNLPFH